MQPFLVLTTGLKRSENVLVVRAYDGILRTIQSKDTAPYVHLEL